MAKTCLSRSSSAFTLVEFLTAIAVLAIVSALAAPSLTSLIEQSRLATATNTTLSMLTQTRSEAVTRGHKVTVCTSTDLIHCTAGSGWHGGWIMFSDPNGNGTRDDGEKTLRAENARNDAVTVIGNQHVRDYVSYSAYGATRTSNGALQLGTITLCLNGEARRIILNSAGRPRLGRGGC